MTLYNKWDFKTGLTFALQFFILISDDLGGVCNVKMMTSSINKYETYSWNIRVLIYDSSRFLIEL